MANDIKDVILEKCKGGNVTAQLRELGLDASGSVKARVARLLAYYAVRETDHKEAMATCSVCNTDSDTNLAACPFCGEAGVVEIIDSDDGKPPAEVIEPEDDDGAVTAEIVLEDEDGDVPDSGEDPDPEDEPGDNEDEEDEEPADELPETDEEQEGEPMTMAEVKKAEKAGKAGGKKKAGKAPAKAGKGSNGKKAGKAPAEAQEATAARVASIAARAAGPAPRRKAADPTVVETTGVVVRDSQALDDQIELIRQAVNGSGVQMWRMGMAAKKILEGKLWKQRTDDNGKPLYSSFNQFCEEDMHLSKVTVYRAMQVTDQFASEELVANLNTRQVRLILGSPKDHRAELTEAAKKGEKGAQLTERANKLRGGRKPLPEPTRGITIAVQPGHQKLKMYKKPNTGSPKLGSVEGLGRAKKLGDGPWCIAELTNKVSLFIKIVADKNTGELIADLEYRRMDPAL